MFVRKDSVFGIGFTTTGTARTGQRDQGKTAKPLANATDEDAKRVFTPLVDSLIALSKCLDYVMNRGHFFRTGQFANESRLNEQDKRGLIEILKTFLRAPAQIKRKLK